MLVTPHPLHHQDRPVVDRLLQVATPSSRDVVDAARLLNRYEGFRSDPSTWDDLQVVLKSWKLTRDELNAMARVAWQSDVVQQFLTAAEDQQVGSGADVNG